MHAYRQTDRQTDINTYILTQVLAYIKSCGGVH